MAKRKLNAMERKLSKQPDLKRQYDAFMQEYIELGHMKLIQNASSNKQQNEKDYPTYYLPHHAVLKEESETTKLRVVFDASAKTESGISLNDVQMVGPTIRQDLFNILIRFQEHRYAITADISKMYRQIRVIPEQCTLQRILWRLAPEQEVQTYELQTVTYGKACSAFLAIRSLHQAAISLQLQFPEAAEIIKRDFYVDDLLSGANDIKNLLRIKEEITQILRSARFNLHKWKSNHSSITQSDGKTSV